MAPSYDTIGFLAREAELFRKIGHVLLDGERVDAQIKRLIIAEDFFGHAETSVDEALWQRAREHRPRAAAGRAEDHRRRGYRRLARCLPPHPGLRDPVDAASLHPVPQRRSRAGHQGALRDGGRRSPLPRPRRRARFAPRSPSACARSRQPGTRDRAADHADAAARARAFPTAPPSPSSARKRSAIPASPAMPACRRSRFPRPRPPAAPSASPSSAGRAATRPCSISPSALSLS